MGLRREGVQSYRVLSRMLSRTDWFGCKEREEAHEKPKLQTQKWAEKTDVLQMVEDTYDSDYKTIPSLLTDVESLVV